MSKKETLVNPNPEIDGYISNAETAIKIAEAVWLPIYGEGIYNKKPFKAELKDSIWVVEGTVSPDKLGGAPYLRIQKKDGKILEVTHFQ
ncbi:NTF2 fold immunity protein [Chryseolinea serpens]|uniref:NTF2 fold immunity protein n=1 Tax=Chryseolinea serpens TaxID=947013 RepID=UPI0009352A34|nr:NTF2 fold immunity protein [Chryseolinea serpens]